MLWPTLTSPPGQYAAHGTSASITIPSIGTAGDSLPFLHPDFGEKIDECYFFPFLEPDIEIFRPIEAATYYNLDGYTTVINPFVDVIGYGDTPEDSKSDAISDLKHTWKTYVGAREEELTPRAVALRRRLMTYMGKAG